MTKGYLKHLFEGAAIAALMALSPNAMADPSQAGMSAGGAWAKDFNPGESFKTATSALGLEDTKTSGELGGKVGLQVKQKQQRNFKCRDGARLTAGGIRVLIDECKQSESGELEKISVTICDALTQGIRCSEDRYTVTREIPIGEEAAFSGGDLYGSYRVEAECTSTSCVMTMHQLHGDAWGDNDMRQQGNDRVNSDPNHPSNTIADVRDNPTYEQGGRYAEDRSKCLGGQINQLFSEGDIPVSCDPEDPRTIDFLDINGGGRCEPDEITSEKCIVDIPTEIVACEPESRNCDVERETRQFTCEMRREVTKVGSELQCEEKTFSCSASAKSCCRIEVTCDGTSTATIKHRDCCGLSVSYEGVQMGDFLNGQQYSPMPGSVIRCNPQGQCTVDFRNYLCRSQDPQEIIRNVNSFNIGYKALFEDKWVDSCQSLDERSPDLTNLGE